MEGHNDVWCPIWWKRVSRICGFSAPHLANLLASSLPWMFVCALTFLMVVLWREVLMAFLICVMRSLSG